MLQNIILQPRTQDTRRFTFDYDSADWVGWSTELKEKFRDALLSDNEDPHEMFRDFLSIINGCCDKFIPKKQLCKHSKPFWSSSLSDKSKKLQNAQKRFKQRSDPTNKKLLDESKRDFQDALVSEKNQWIHKKLEGLNTKDSMDFWKRYKRQFCPRPDNGMGHLLKPGTSELTQVDAEKEEILFSTFFEGFHLNNQDFDDEWLASMEEHVTDLEDNSWNVETVCDGSREIDEHQPVPILEDSSQEENLDSEFLLNSEILFDEVVASISAQKTSGKCSDMDKFHPLLLKKLPNSAIRFLTLLFNKVLEKGDWIWSSSMVSFIRKMDKDSYLVPGSFRPITIASYVGKIMERVLQQRLLLYCQRNNVIDNAQEGFLPQRSTTRYLYKMSAAIAEARRKRLSVMLLFIDFEKAFDSVSTTAMIYKLNMYGISGAFLRLISCFLNNRSVTLKVNNFIGHRRRVGRFGLPQGSVLSPLLFIIYVADLLENVHSVSSTVDNSSAMLFKYADDGSIMVATKSTSDSFKLMQEICDRLTAWCRRWRLVINCSRNKTEAIVMKNKDTAIVCKLHISGKEIEYVRKSKVLGVLIDEDLSFILQGSCCFSTEKLLVRVASAICTHNAEEGS